MVTCSVTTSGTFTFSENETPMSRLAESLFDVSIVWPSLAEPSYWSSTVVAEASVRKSVPEYSIPDASETSGSPVSGSISASTAARSESSSRVPIPKSWHSSAMPSAPAACASARARVAASSRSSGVTEANGAQRRL
jgi:hypothetical protein